MRANKRISGNVPPAAKRRSSERHATDDDDREEQEWLRKRAESERRERVKNLAQSLARIDDPDELAQRLAQVGDQYGDDIAEQVNGRIRRLLKQRERKLDEAAKVRSANRAQREKLTKVRPPKPPAPAANPRLRQLLLMLGSANDGEALNAARALCKAITGIGLDLHQFAAMTESAVLSGKPRQIDTAALEAALQDYVAGQTEITDDELQQLVWKFRPADPLLGELQRRQEQERQQTLRCISQCLLRLGFSHIAWGTFRRSKAELKRQQKAAADAA